MILNTVTGIVYLVHAVDKPDSEENRVRLGSAEVIPVNFNKIRGVFQSRTNDQQQTLQKCFKNPGSLYLLYQTLTTDEIIGIMPVLDSMKDSKKNFVIDHKKALIQIGEKQSMVIPYSN